MKKLLSILFVFAVSIGANAQLSTVKLGANYNAEIIAHKLGKINYPSMDISFERALGKKFSINGTYNYSKLQYDLSSDFYSSSHSGYNNYNHALILEGRFYLTSNTTGLFFQLGIPFTLSIEERFDSSPLFHGTDNRYTYAISTFGGIGIKYPLSSRFGLEMNMSMSPSLNFLGVDYGTSGFIKSGIKLFYTFGKSK